MSRFTKNAIVDTFLELLNTKSLDKITVKDIVESCGVNRNTFYYYFNDIYDVLAYLFEEQTRKVMEKFADDGTFYEEYRSIASIILEHRQGIIHVYHSKNQEVLENYLKTLMIRLTSRFVREAAENTDLPEEDLEFITLFYSHAIIGSTLEWIKNGLPPYSEGILLKISDSFEGTIQDMIQVCLNRNRKK